MFTKIYGFYKKYFPEIILLTGVFGLMFLAKYVPYINIIIVNVDPLLSSIVVVWIIFYLMRRPSTRSIMIYALIIFACCYFFVVTHQTKIAELLASLSFSMIFTAIIIEAAHLKKELKKKGLEKSLEE